MFCLRSRKAKLLRWWKLHYVEVYHMYQGTQTGVVCILPLLIALRRKLRELQYVLIAATSPLLYVRVHS